MSDKVFEIPVTSTIKVTAQDIDDIMSSALDGGITYWCTECTVVGNYLGEYASEQISRGGELLIYDYEEGVYRKLTLEKMLNGIKMAYENCCYPDYEWCDGKELDCCQIDAEVADCIIQYALFNDWVYG